MVLLPLILAVLAREAPAQAQPCARDTAVKATPGRSGYQPRDTTLPTSTRCEGVYIQAVAAPPALSVASFTRGFADFDVASRDTLRIQWDAPVDTSITLRVRSIKRNTYYGMDTRRPGGNVEFRWPKDVLRNVGLHRADIGILGWMSVRVGNELLPVHVPVRVLDGARAAGAGPYELLLYTRIRLREVFTSVFQVDSSGTTIRTLSRGDSLGRPPYGALSTIRVPVAAPDRPGLYRIEISAFKASGRDSVLTVPPLYFYHPGS